MRLVLGLLVGAIVTFAGMADAGAQKKLTPEQIAAGRWVAQGDVKDKDVAGFVFDANGRVTVLRKDGAKNTSTAASYQILDRSNLEITTRKPGSKEVQTDLYRIEELTCDNLTLVGPDGTRREFRRPQKSV